MQDQMIGLPVAILLIIIAICLFWFARRQYSNSGLPRGKLIYTDTHGWKRVEKPLFCKELKLTGKPDYLIERDGQIIPVEVKSTRSVDEPYEAHIHQLAAYCILVDRSYHQRPNFGILRYPDRTYEIDFSSELEQNVLFILGEMQNKIRNHRVDRSHEEPQRCVHCGYVDVCDQALRI